MNPIQPLQQILKRNFTTTTHILARHSNKRLGRAVIEPPLKPAPKSEFFANLPQLKKLGAKELSELEAQTKDFKTQFELDQQNLQLQHGIKEVEKEFLIEGVPAGLGARSIAEASQTEKYKERAKWALLSQSLETANSKGYLTFNKLKCIEKFGKNEKDTGSSEVQAAIWTLRIRNLERHMASNKQDKANQRALTKLYHKRAKILKYLKRQSLQRYFETLKILGVTQEMVEGEISIRQHHN